MSSEIADDIREEARELAGAYETAAGEMRNTIDTLLSALSSHPEERDLIVATVERIDRVRVKIRCHAVLLRAGFAPGKALPDNAGPDLHDLIYCRTQFPSPSYHNLFRIVVRGGVAYCEYRPGQTGEHDRHYYEPLAGRGIP